MIIRIDLSSACFFLCYVNLFTWYNAREAKNNTKTPSIPRETKETTSYDLAIGILSAPNNFALRDAIRKTWLNETHHLSDNKTFSLKAWFIVGNSSCDVPPDYRLDPYTCEWWHFNYSVTANAEFSTCKVLEERHQYLSLTPVYQGFSFQVNYPVIITKLGVLAEVLSPDSNVTVALLDGGSKEILIKTSISSLQPGILVDGFLFRPVEQYILPKGYEGIVLVEGPLLSSASVRLKWHTESGLITYKMVYKSSDDFDGLKFTENLVVGPSLFLSVTDLNNLKSLVDKKADAIAAWQNSLHSMRSALLQEHESWKDIVLVDVIDVYRNLSMKMLKFFTWLSSNNQFSYLLKTDDDCIINLPAVIHKLKTIASFKMKGKWWWSRFRTQWPVNFFGKWKDYDYPSSVYPRFPCGGGYILSADLVKWSALNAHVLFPFQGEDVSLGIWFAALNPVHIEDENWSCDETCTPSSLNMAQLSVEKLYAAWKTYQKCGNICYCD